MSITPQLRALMEQRARIAAAEADRELIRLEVERRALSRCNRILSAIDDAAPRLDAGHADLRKWKPSELIRIGYFVISSSDAPNAEYRATQFVRKKLAA